MSFASLQVIAVNWTHTGGLMRTLLFNAMPDFQPGNEFYNKHQARTGRLFLENVAAALAPGTFYLAANCSAAYKHCGARRGRTLFYWPTDSSARSAPVIPRLFSLVEVRGARHVVLSNFTFADTSYWSGGAWHNIGSPGTDGPTDGAIVINRRVQHSLQSSWRVMHSRNCTC